MDDSILQKIKERTMEIKSRNILFSNDEIIPDSYQPNIISEEDCFNFVMEDPSAWSR